MEEETDESAPAASSSNGISNSSATTAWFEFILDRTLLERHLSDPNAGKFYFGTLMLIKHAMNT